MCYFICEWHVLDGFKEETEQMEGIHVDETQKKLLHTYYYYLTTTVVVVVVCILLLCLLK